MRLKQLTSIVENNFFIYFIVFIIVVNSILIGVEITYQRPFIENTQRAILMIFILELVMRFLGRRSTISYISDGWNWFDIIIIGVALTPITLLPKNVQANPDLIAVLRILRVLRVFRTFRSIKELRLISSVLIRSIKSLGITALFFLIFIFSFHPPTT